MLWNNLNPLGTFLPYRKLQYLESSGTQYIDTNWIFKTSTGSKLEIGFYTGSASTSSCMFGARASDIAKNSIYQVSAERLVVGDNDGYVIYFPPGPGGLYMFQSLVLFDGVATMNGYTVATKNPECVNSFYLFAMNNSNGGQKKYYGYGRIYYCRLYEDAVSVHDFIPVLWKSGKPYTDGNTDQTVTPASDKPGMYDTVSKKLFVNQGTGEFLYA